MPGCKSKRLILKFIMDYTKQQLQRVLDKFGGLGKISSIEKKTDLYEVSTSESRYLLIPFEIIHYGVIIPKLLEPNYREIIKDAGYKKYEDLKVSNKVVKITHAYDLYFRIFRLL